MSNINRDASALMLLEAKRASELMEAKFKLALMQLAREHFVAQRGPVTVDVNGRGQVVSMTIHEDTDTADMAYAAILAASEDARVRATALFEEFKLDVGMIR